VCEEIMRKNNELKAQGIISIEHPDSKEFELTFRRILIKTAVEIYFVYELQFSRVYRQDPDQSASQSQALDILAKFSSDICMDWLIKSESHKNLEVSLVKRDLLRKLTKLRILFYDQLLLDKLCYTEKKENGKEKKKKISKYKIFADPAPAFFLTKTTSESTANECQDEKLESLKILYFTSKKIVKKIEKKLEKSKNGFKILRRPFQSEWEEFIDPEQMYSMDVPEGLENPENFIWQDRTDLIEIIYNELLTLKPLEGEESLRVWRELQKLEGELKTIINQLKSMKESVDGTLKLKKP